MSHLITLTGSVLNAGGLARSLARNLCCRQVPTQRVSEGTSIHVIVAGLAWNIPEGCSFAKAAVGSVSALGTKADRDVKARVIEGALLVLRNGGARLLEHTSLFRIQMLVKDPVENARAIGTDSLTNVDHLRVRRRLLAWTRKEPSVVSILAQQVIRKDKSGSSFGINIIWVVDLDWQEIPGAGSGQMHATL